MSKKLAPGWSFSRVLLAGEIMSQDPRPYRKNVGALLRRDDGLVLMGERINQPGSWQFPQGGVDAGEDLEEALLREIEEELGLIPAQHYCQVLARGPEVCYDFPAELHSSWARKFRGQAQTLFLVQFKGADTDFRLDASNDPEFSSIRWVTVEQSVELLWAVKRPILQQSLQVFRPFLENYPLE